MPSIKAISAALLGSCAFLFAAAIEQRDAMVTDAAPPHSCYTATITQPSPHIRCSDFNTKTCDPIFCLRAETTSIPCPDKDCPVTPTSISYTPCQTECYPSCPTVTISCSSTLPATEY
ncbi:predicted protein [Uncinocarpus reesii 1704]|uniref:Uncharacterized protein n=1 Tax=Uncinocarpus reesii (strain UAMH 1704) TaxID=336963 RepID=C4JDP5_UNCRE|nr:uncharacterized protein UREG_00359 [Uncinocarpus reesii 1704]EEP75513.1 predicted protein [Uncinocarpus reesii 1704]